MPVFGMNGTEHAEACAVRAHSVAEAKQAPKTKILEAKKQDPHCAADGKASHSSLSPWPTASDSEGRGQTTKAKNWQQNIGARRA